jgi:hypothetical protein
MMRRYSFRIKIRQDRHTSWIVTDRTHKFSMESLPRKSHGRVSGATAGAERDTVDIGFGAELKVHEALMRPFGYRLKLIAMA